MNDASIARLLLSYFSVGVTVVLSLFFLYIFLNWKKIRYQDIVQINASSWNYKLKLSMYLQFSRFIFFIVFFYPFHFFFRFLLGRAHIDSVIEYTWPYMCIQPRARYTLHTYIVHSISLQLVCKLNQFTSLSIFR